MTGLKLPSDYDSFLKGLKERVRAAQLRASLAVNRELVMLYWGIGRDILARQKEHGWGARIIDRLAADLRQEFPEVTGFSPRNLKYMRALAESWPDEPIVQQLAAQIPWGHNVRILDYVENAAETFALPVHFAYIEGMTVEAIKEAITVLAPDEKTRLAAWLLQQDMEEWDRQLDQDFSPGGRGLALLEEAEADVREGRTKPMDEFLAEAKARRKQPGS